MHKQITFTLNETSTFLKRTSDYFYEFSVENQSADQVVFKRGNILLNMVTFNPLQWKSTVTIKLQSDTITADFDITTFGQMVTPKEEKLWDAFINNYKLSMLGSADFHAENEANLNSSKRDSLKYIKQGLIGAVLVGIPFGLIAYFTDIDLLAPMGAAGGASLFILRQIEKDKRVQG